MKVAFVSKMAIPFLFAGAGAWEVSFVSSIAIWQIHRISTTTEPRNPQSSRPLTNALPNFLGRLSGAVGTTYSWCKYAVGLLIRNGRTFFVRRGLGLEPMITSKGTWLKIAKAYHWGVCCNWPWFFEMLRGSIMPSSEAARRGRWHCGVLSEHLTLHWLMMTKNLISLPPRPFFLSFFLFFMCDVFVQAWGLWQTLSRRRKLENDKTPLPRPEEQTTEKIEGWTWGAANLWKLESSNCRQEWQMLLLIESPGACSLRWHYSRPFYRIDSASKKKRSSRFRTSWRQWSRRRANGC